MLITHFSKYNQIKIQVNYGILINFQYISTIILITKIIVKIVMNLQSTGPSIQMWPSKSSWSDKIVLPLE